jgi:hypothetical protein
LKHDDVGPLVYFASEMPFGEGTARMALEVNLKFGRLCSIVEREGYVQPPWTEFFGMRDFACVVAAESILQIVGQTNVMTRRIGLAGEDVNVGKFHQRLFSGLWRALPSEVPLQLFGYACPDLACPGVVHDER